LDIKTHIPGKCQAKMKIEIGAMLPQAREHQRLPANQQKLEKRPGTGFSLTVLRRHQLC
jgi:hypothetical protein